MNGNTPSSARTLQGLRQEAEKLALKRQYRLLSGLEPPSPEKTRQTLHELLVHQIELEMLNEELRRIQLELETTRARYFNYYDLAPVGYCTLDETELIVEANLTAAAWLGMARDTLVGKRLRHFIFKEDEDRYYLMRKQLLRLGDARTCELRVLKNDGTHFWSQLTVTVAKDSESRRVLRVVLSDINERVLLQKQSEPTQKMQALGQVTVVAHDFNNILASILGYTEMALERVTPDMDGELVSSLKEVKQASQCGRDLIAKLLASIPGGQG